MTSITTKTNQTVLDLALQLYGNADAVSELLRLNVFPNNDSNGFNIAMPIGAAVTVVYDETSSLMNKNVLNVIDEMASYKNLMSRGNRFTKDYLTNVQAAGLSISMPIGMSVDRLVRDVCGEKNIDYVTSNLVALADIYSYFLFPFVGGTAGHHSKEVFQYTVGESYFLATGVSHDASGVKRAIGTGIQNIVYVNGLEATNMIVGAYVGNDHVTIISNGIQVKYYKNKVLQATYSFVSGMMATAVCGLVSGYVGANMVYKAIYGFSYVDQDVVMARMDDYLKSFQRSLNRA